MKLRIKGNSLRVRLDRRDLDQLVTNGRVEDVIRFGVGEQNQLTYAVMAGSVPRGQPQVQYRPGQILLLMDPADAVEWQQSERVGFDLVQSGEAGDIRLLLEKDFACLDRPAGSEAGDEWAFPNPSNVC
ncbi:hypothetical protein GC163_16090 [bacterium]|nr:hypothetical protein [bacterium]